MMQIVPVKVGPVEAGVFPIHRPAGQIVSVRVCQSELTLDVLCRLPNEWVNAQVVVAACEKANVADIDAYDDCTYLGLIHFPTGRAWHVLDAGGDERVATREADRQDTVARHGMGWGGE